MQDLNRVDLIGRVGADPEVRTLASGEEVANFSLATSDRWKDRAGQKQERTEWHRVAVFGPLAAVVRQWVRKGDLLFVSGSLRTRKWTGADGIERFATDVHLSGPNARLQLLGGRREEPASTGKPPLAMTGQSVEAFDDEVPF